MQETLDNRKGRQFRVGAYLDVSRQYGRETALGIADWAAQAGHWEFAAGGDVSSLVAKTRAGDLDGIIARVPDTAALEMFSRLGLPVVDVYGQCRMDGISTVECDNTKISRLAAEWFLARRYVNYAYIGYRGVPFSDARRDAFCQAVCEAGFKCAVCEMPLVARGKMSRALLGAEKFGAASDEARLVRFLKRLKENTAVFCANDARAYQVLHAAEIAAVEVPRRISVMGVDNDPILCTFSSPGITSIDPGAREVGMRAARLLEALMRLERMCMAEPLNTRHIAIAPRTVVERGSTDFDPIEPPWLRDVVRYMREHMAEGINATDIMSFAGVSHTKLEQAFAKAFDCPPHKFLADLRLREAMRLLRETDLASSEIAAMTGFSSAQYFSRLVSSRYGVAPGRWRLNVRSEP